MNELLGLHIKFKDLRHSLIGSFVFLILGTMKLRGSTLWQSIFENNRPVLYTKCFLDMVEVSLVITLGDLRDCCKSCGFVWHYCSDQRT